MKNDYWLEGQMNIPKEKKPELNENVLKILKQSGIRKRKTMEIAGNQVTVVQEIEPDEKGLVWFDYSIFEKRDHEPAYYDMNTCRLYANNCGEAEYALAVNLVLTMQEAYSTDYCFVMCGNEVSCVNGYACLIEQLIGLKLSFPNREQVWDMLLFFKSKGCNDTETERSVWNNFPYGYGEPDLEQLLACMVCPNYLADEPEHPFRGKKAEICQVKTMERVYYIYELFQKLVESRGDEEVRGFLKDLLDQDLAGRERLAQKDDAFGCIAEVARYELPGYIVAAYGCAVKKPFWEIWFSLGIAGYRDIDRKEEDLDKSGDEESNPKQLAFFRALLREDEDEFLEYWDEEGLYLSKNMQENLDEWEQIYGAIDNAEAAGICTEAVLPQILKVMQSVWKCRLVDEKLVKDFMDHPDDIRYKKALWIFIKIIKEASEEDGTDAVRIKLSGFASLLINPKGRWQLFGF